MIAAWRKRRAEARKAAAEREERVCARAEVIARGVIVALGEAATEEERDATVIALHAAASWVEDHAPETWARTVPN
jgi:hypothetical protein